MSEGERSISAAYDPGETWVIKVGSSLVTRDGSGLATELLGQWVEDISNARKAGRRIVVVSSGAVAEGMYRLGMTSRPHQLHLLQAAAAVGQMGLIQAYESRFQEHGLRTAQVLLTHDDVRSRERYINARSTLRSLIELGVIPIVNENDCVVTDEIRFGDNDTLAALVANLIEADTVMLLTDQAGLYTGDPRHDPEAELVRQLSSGDTALDKMAGGSGSWGRGGMVTKVRAARTAARSGANTIIAAGREPGVIAKLGRGEITGTLLTADSDVLDARKQWLAGIRAEGTLTLDDGAVRVLRLDGSSLLPVGVTAVKGEFERGDMVSCVDAAGREIARGLVNYNHREARKIIGRSSDELDEILGVWNDVELIHRDQMVVT